MGEQVAQRTFSYSDRRMHRVKLRQCLDALYLLADEDRFDAGETLTGMELEVCLVDSDCEPLMKNHEVLTDIEQRSILDGATVQDELGKFNLELNLAPRPIAGNGLSDYESLLRAWLAELRESARRSTAEVALIGTLPTVRSDHARLETLSPGARYRLLNDEILAARGEEIDLDIQGVERLRSRTDSIAPESVNTSAQFHLQLNPENFAAHWNAAQAIAGVQLAIGANSPYLFGNQLWAETRIILFEQSTDTRSNELRVQGVRPRTFFGEKWISSPMELFEENLRYFPPLLPLCDEEDPIAALAEGKEPQLSELKIHNGTIYRWNRPVYDIGPNGPHLRIENRSVPAGPTPIDICANMAFYLGLVTELAHDETPVWNTTPFATAERNFLSAARHGISAQLSWPGYGEMPATQLVREVLLGKSADGLNRLGVDSAVAQHYLSVVEGRCRRRVNGASWQVRYTTGLEHNHGMSRPEALRTMLRQYLDNAADNVAVHEWPIRL